MNLYAINAAYAPGAFGCVELVLAESDAKALEQGVFVAAHDARQGPRFTDGERVPGGGEPAACRRGVGDRRTARVGLGAPGRGEGHCDCGRPLIASGA